MSAPLPNNKRDAHFAPSDDLERLAQTIIDVLRGVLNIEPRVVDELRSIAASQPVARNAGTPRIPRGRKTVRPCGTCSQVKLKVNASLPLQENIIHLFDFSAWS